MWERRRHFSYRRPPSLQPTLRWLQQGQNATQLPSVAKAGCPFPRVNLLAVDVTTGLVAHRGVGSLMVNTRQEEHDSVRDAEIHLSESYEQEQMLRKEIQFQLLQKHFPKNNTSTLGQLSKVKPSSTAYCGKFKVIKLLDIQVAQRSHTRYLNYYSELGNRNDQSQCNLKIRAFK